MRGHEAPHYQVRNKINFKLLSMWNDIVWEVGVTLYLEVHYLKSAARSEVHLSVQVDGDLRYIDRHSS